MKKFEFTLSKLLNYKDQVLKKEKNELADLRGQMQTAINQRDKLEEEMHMRNTDFIRKSQHGMTAQAMISEKKYLASLVNQIRIYNDTIALFEQKIEKQLNVVVAANKEVSSLEKLKDKQYEQYKKDLQKAEELVIEEYVANSSYYNN